MLIDRTSGGPDVFNARYLSGPHGDIGSVLDVPRPTTITDRPPAKPVGSRGTVGRERGREGVKSSVLAG